MRILFMGTPEFALFSLRALVESGEDIIGVVTQPDKPRGRGYTLTPPPVKVYAMEQNIPVYQPTRVRDEEFAALLAQLDPELIIVTAYGKILPQNVLEYPKYGCINVHGSLLPEYRGAAPMQRAIMEGKCETGITTMMMDIGMDTGDMLLQGVVPILEDDNFEDIHDKMGVCGAEVLLDTLKELREGTLRRTPQDHTRATHAAKIEKEDCLIDFTKNAKAVHDQIRGLSPIPLSFTHLPDGKLLKIIEAKISQTGLRGKGGEVLSLAEGKITVACGDGAIDLITVLPEGKKRMAAGEFINGRKLNVGDQLH